MVENDHFSPESWAARNPLMNHTSIVSHLLTTEEEMSHFKLLVHFFHKGVVLQTNVHIFLLN